MVNLLIKDGKETGPDTVWTIARKEVSTYDAVNQDREGSDSLTIRGRRAYLYNSAKSLLDGSLDYNTVTADRCWSYSAQVILGETERKCI